MASQQGTVDFLLDQLAGAGGVSAKKMFGEYGLYCDGKMFAIVADDMLFIKPTEAGRAWITAQGALQEAPPYPQAKPYFLIDGGLWDERDWLSQLARRTTDALPLPKPKPGPKVKKSLSNCLSNPALAYTGHLISVRFRPKAVIRFCAHPADSRAE